MGVVFGVLFGFLLLIAALAVLVNVYYLYVHQKYAHLPTPKGARFYLGHLPILFSHLKEEKYFLDLLKSWSDECGPVYVWWKVYSPVVTVAHAESVKELGKVKYPKPYIAPLIKLWNRQRFS